MQILARERAGIEDLVKKYREYKKVAKELEDVKSMHIAGPDEEMRTLVKQEMEKLESRLDQLILELKRALLPRDENDKKDIIMEIRAGTGGNEAGLFAADLFRMYSRYASRKLYLK